MGVSVEINGLSVADDPAFSPQPFLTAHEVALRVEFSPLLTGHAKLRELEIVAPEIRILRNARSELNIGTLGEAPGQAAQAAGSPKRGSALAKLAVRQFRIDDAQIIYSDLSQPAAAPAKLHGLGLSVENFPCWKAI
jgi:uncharacterized protein involved in outer membrane biogenesis